MRIIRDFLKWAFSSKAAPDRAREPILKAGQVIAGEDWTADERRYLELTGNKPHSVTRREREAGALAEAQTLFTAQRAARQQTSLDMLFGEDGIPFLKADGIIFGTQASISTVPYLHDHSIRKPSDIVKHRLERAGTIIVGPEGEARTTSKTALIAIYDTDGHVYIGPRIGKLGAQEVDYLNWLQDRGYGIHRDADPLRALVSPDVYVIGKVDGYIGKADGEMVVPDYALHTALMGKLGLPALREDDFKRKATLPARKVTALRPNKPETP
ncbi:MAG: hypothetical protein KGQ41_05055 [Alphaproteobacteria bacterium]|nr:hypothetical protein [Alphaproteobacteria bacterium]